MVPVAPRQEKSLSSNRELMAPVATWNGVAHAPVLRNSQLRTITEPVAMAMAGPCAPSASNVHCSSSTLETLLGVLPSHLVVFWPPLRLVRSTPNVLRLTPGVYRSKWQR